MNKAFVREDAEDDDELEPPEPAGLPARNYITPAGHARIRAELLQLLDVERPEVVRIVSWAASNGDRSENGDYLYGKKRLREIDRRIRFLTRRLDRAEIVDPLQQSGNDQVFFGATVTYEQSDGVVRTVRIVGIDEVDPLHGQISWISPVAKALIKAREGDTVSLMTPAGRLDLEILEVRYDADPVDAPAGGAATGA
jgi:transcription elongation factor GreB